MRNTTETLDIVNLATLAAALDLQAFLPSLTFCPSLAFFLSLTFNYLSCFGGGAGLASLIGEIRTCMNFKQNNNNRIIM
jgi:hypothetical protein